MLGAGHKETVPFLPVQSIPAALSLSASGCGLEAGSEPCKTVLNTRQELGSISSVLESCSWAH